MILVYVYLYSLYHERYIGIWLLSWLIHLLRILVFDSGLVNWLQLPFGFTVYQLLSIFPLIQADAVVQSIHVKLELADIPHLYLDENEIRQLLLNLIRNGLEAMTEGGNLYVCTFQENGQVVLLIRDQGHGIPTHILENLGSPFITTKKTGTGLGLPICYRIANRHNATIEVDTNNTGTTVIIRFTL